MLYIRNCVYLMLTFSCYINGCDSQCNSDHSNDSKPVNKIERLDLYKEYNDDLPGEDNIASTLLDICDDGKIDAALQTMDGTIYLFKRFGFVIVDLDGAKANESYVTKFTFTFLPIKPDYGLTITDPNNVRYGLSLFFKNNKFYVYNNTEFQNIVFAKSYDTRIGTNSVPFYYYGDSVLAFYDKRFSSVEMFLRKIFIFLDFHTIELPDYLTQETRQNIPNFFNYVHQIIALPNDSWMVFLDYDNYGMFCVINNVSTNLQFPCKQRHLNELINCPDIYTDLVEENWLISVWESSSLNQDRLLSSVKGILIAILYGLSILYLITYFEHGSYKSGSTIDSK